MATLLPRLGVRSPPEDYTLGLDLLGERRRPFQAVSDLSRIAFIDAESKMSFALKSTGLFRSRARTRADASLDESVVLAEKRDALFALLDELAPFRGGARSGRP